MIPMSSPTSISHGHSNNGNTNEADTQVSAGHMLVRQLEREGVQRIYTVPGESFLEVLDGLYESPIETIVTRHEGGAGFMAVAEGRLTGIPGVAMVTRGPGAANAFISVHTAWQDATPLVLFVGLVPIPDRGREAFQEFDLHGWFGSTAKWVTKLDHPESASRVIAEGMRIARSGRPGPVVIGLPEDILREPSDPETTAPTPRRASAGSVAELEWLQARIDEAERPLVIVGGDGWHGDAGSRVSAWAGALGVPIAAHWRSHDAVPHDHPSETFVGILGHNHADYIAELFDEADLHVFIGIPRVDVVSGGFSVGLDVPAIVITSGEPVGHAGHLLQHIPADVAAWAAALPEVEETNSSKRGPSDEKLARLRTARSQLNEFRKIAPLNPATGVDLSVAFGILRDRLDDDAITTFGAGNYMQWAIRYLSHNAPGSLVAPRNGAMGMGVPASVAASLIHPGRQVVSLAGDGCFMMNCQELVTAAAYGAAPLTIVFDNSTYGTIREHQEQWYPGRQSGTKLENPDFAELAASFGCFGERVESTDDFADALDRALGHDGAALLHVIQDPEVLKP